MTKKWKTGYAAGVFDMFHIGHLNILQKAKEQCEYLIVAVSTDELCLQYKHRPPVIPQNQRVAIISELKCVDMVVLQENMNKAEAAEKYQVDVMFAGTDWKGTAAWNQYEKELLKVGCEVVFFDYTEGISSSIIKDKLMNEV